MSKRNPLYSTVRAMPPTCASCSTTRTGRPWVTSWYAAVRPAGPAPMIMTGADFARGAVSSGSRGGSGWTVISLRVAAQKSDQEKRVVPRYVSRRRVTFPQLGAHRDRGHDQRELRRRPPLRDREHARGECEEHQHDRASHRLVAGERRHQPEPHAAALSPESERARSVRFGT